MRRFFLLLAALITAANPVLALTAGQRLLLLNNPRATVAIGAPTSLAFPSTVWTSVSDIAPASQFVPFAADLTIKGMTNANDATKYGCSLTTGVCGSFAAPALLVPVTYPGFDSSGNATTGAVNFVGTSYLRQTYNNTTLPSEAANSGNGKFAFSFNDVMHVGDLPGTATTLSGLYINNTTSSARSGIPVTNSSTLAYPSGIGVWGTSAGEYVGASQSFTVEFIAGHAYAIDAAPFSVVKFTFCDDGPCTHSFTKSATAMSLSTRQLSWACTGTNGSAVLTSCANTNGVIDGERLTVVGIPGQPRVLSHTAGAGTGTITLGSNQTCVTTLNSGNISVKSTGVVAGDGLADGGFVNAKLFDSTITAPGTTVSITSATATADITTASLKSTLAVIHTNATAVPADATGHACTINHIYTGTTGAVTAYLGNPQAVYSVTASAADFTGASFVSSTAAHVRAQAYPVRGNVILDTQNGADGTACDWFKSFVGGVCSTVPANCTSAACFNTDGTSNSANLHNLWFYYDSGGTYAPAFVWVTSTGTCPSNATCVSTTATDGGATTQVTSIANAITALKLFNNARHAVSDANGGVICLTASASPYASMGADESAATTVNKPPLILTSATAAGTCSIAPSTNSDTTVAITQGTTTTNRKPPPGMRINNLSLTGLANTFATTEAAQNTAFQTNWLVFNYDKLVATQAAVLNKVGNWEIFNSFVDDSAAKGNYFTPASSTSGALRAIAYSTMMCQPFVGSSGEIPSPFNALGNVSWGCGAANPATLSSIATVPQALSSVFADNKWMGMLNVKFVWVNPSNYLGINNVTEEMNSSTSPAEQIAGDSSNLPITNIFRAYETVVGSRTNDNYLEGVPILPNVITNTSTFTASNQFLLVSYALVGNPTVETSTDGIPVTASTFVSTAVTGTTQSLTVELPCDKNYVAYVYVGPTVTGAGSSGTLANYATVTGQAGNTSGGGGITMCQTVTVTGIGAAHTSPSVAGSTSRNYLKSNFFEHFNIDQAVNMKGDPFGGTTGQANSVASGGKVGNFQGRFHAWYVGNVSVFGTSIGSGFGPSTGQGEFPGYLYSMPTSNPVDLSWVTYLSDRSMGNSVTTPLTPATNIGHGNYCLSGSTAHGLSQVPAHFAAWPYDIQGRARLNGGTGAAGAYESGCT